MAPIYPNWRDTANHDVPNTNIQNNDGYPRLLDQVRTILRLKHYSIRTEKSHKDVSTTMIYTYVLNRGGRAVQSPGDTLFQLGKQ
jgi:hypothetical protein